MINSLIQLLFYGTPIVWPVDQLMSGRDPACASTWVLPIVKAEPALPPAAGDARRRCSGRTWLRGQLDRRRPMAIVGWALALVFMRNYRARVSYWV